MNSPMSIQRVLSFVAFALLGAAFSSDARADLSVNVVNKSGVDASQVFIMFGAAPLQAKATINGARILLLRAGFLTSWQPSRISG